MSSAQYSKSTSSVLDSLGAAKNRNASVMLEVRRSSYSSVMTP
ncbi:hypothetical protein [Picosynechococcus sp. NKBG15041c]|nr:hypothetical protein [Picosynechococcus sp. NKBG15041c]